MIGASYDVRARQTSTGARAKSSHKGQGQKQHKHKHKQSQSKTSDKGAIGEGILKNDSQSSSSPVKAYEEINNNTSTSLIASTHSTTGTRTRASKDQHIGIILTVGRTTDTLSYTLSRTLSPTQTHPISNAISPTISLQPLVGLSIDTALKLDLIDPNYALTLAQSQENSGTQACYSLVAS